MKIDLGELTNHGIISKDTEEKIRAFYQKKPAKSQNKLLVVFGILGAILIGLGVILIIAHNWDNLSKYTRTAFAFLPLILGQIICVFVLICKIDSQAWRESSSGFLFFSIAAVISLIGQIYNIPGELDSFLFTWMLLSIPVVYLMKSSIVSLFYLVGITWYACLSGYWSHQQESIKYWLMLFLITPYLYQLFKRTPQSNFTRLHLTIIPLSIIISLGIVADQSTELMNMAYMTLFGLFSLIGNSQLMKRKSYSFNGFSTLGALGTVTLMMVLSFDGLWITLSDKNLSFYSSEMLAFLIISFLAASVLAYKIYTRSFVKPDPFETVWLVFIPVFFIGLHTPIIAQLLVNLIIVIIALATIWNGAKNDHLGILNFGLLIIMVLISCRFFDTELSYFQRGVVFVLTGLSFIAANVWTLRRRKVNEE